MNIRFLDWDSRFFGLRIGRIDLQTQTDAAELPTLQDELHRQYDLLYVFDADAIGFEAKGARLVDEKILYSKPCEPRKQFSDISFYQDNQPSADLYHLALVSGGYSRFKLDKQFPKGSYEYLYRRWIENACPADGTNKQILTFLDPHGVAKGMITFDYQEQLGHIGLVAVDTDAQHQGIGSKMMSTLDGYLFGQNVKTLEVPTQKANSNACRWYEQNGFAIKSITSIYHWWL